MVTSDIRYVVQIYNDMCAPMGMPKCTIISGRREKSIRARMRENPNFEWSEFFMKASKSDFLCGKVNGWRANIDWLMNPNNFVKVMEGNYDGVSQKGVGGGVKSDGAKYSGLFG